MSALSPLARWSLLALPLCALALVCWWLLGTTATAWSTEWAPAVSTTVPVEQSTAWERPGVTRAGQGGAPWQERTGSARAPAPGSRLPGVPPQARPGPLQGQLRGQVRDNLGNPVPDAAVRVYPAIPAGQFERNVRFVAETLTRHDGEFAVTVSAGDDLTVQVEHPEFAPADPLSDLTVIGNEFLDLPTIVLRIGRTLRGRVESLQGHGVARALVTLERTSSNPLVAAAISYRVWEAKTDLQGRFLLRGLPEGEFRLRATPSAPLATVSQDLVIPAPEDLVLQVGRGSQLAGRIVSATGLPVGDALVCLTSEAPTDTSLHQLTTSRDGQFCFTAIPAGSWRLRASAPGHLSAEVGPLRVLDEPQALEPITLRSRPRIHLALTTRSGSPPATATVEILAETATGAWIQSGLPATEHRVEGGRLTLLGPEPGRYALLVSTPAWAPTRSTVFQAVDSGPDLELTVPLQPAAQVKGRATDPDGNPLSQVLVEAWPAWPPEETMPEHLRRAAIPAALRPRVFSGSEGEFTLAGLAEGPWEIVLRAPRRPPVQIVTEAGLTRDLGIVKVPAGAVVEGRVVDQDELPVRGSEVELVEDASAPGAPVTGYRCRTDDQGRFQLKGVRPGSYAISAGHRSSRSPMLVYADHERSSQQINVEEDKRTSVRLQIHRNVKR